MGCAASKSISMDMQRKREQRELIRLQNELDLKEGILGLEKSHDIIVEIKQKCNTTHRQVSILKFID